MAERYIALMRTEGVELRREHYHELIRAYATYVTPLTSRPVPAPCCPALPYPLAECDGSMD
jgi:hypothetical protein